MANTITITTGGTTTVVTIPEVQNTVEVTYGNITKAEREKLAGIEAGATADQTLSAGDLNIVVENGPNYQISLANTIRPTNVYASGSIAASASITAESVSALSSVKSAGFVGTNKIQPYSTNGAADFFIRAGGGALPKSVYIVESSNTLKRFQFSTSDSKFTIIPPSGSGGPFSLPTSNLRSDGTAAQDGDLITFNASDSSTSFEEAPDISRLLNVGDVSTQQTPATSPIDLFNKSLVYSNLNDGQGARWVAFKDAYDYMVSQLPPVGSPPPLQQFVNEDLVSTDGSSASGLYIADGVFSVNQSGTIPSSLNFYVNGDARINGAIQVGDTSGVTYAFPTTDGSANQLLATDGSGAVTFVTPSTSNVTEGTNLYYTDARVAANSAVAANTAKVGYTDAAVDTRIAAASISDLSDVPTIGTAGQVLVVNAGATALEYANQTGGVTSVNTETGAVVLDTDDIDEGATNLYFTDAKADARIAAASIDDLSDVDTSTVAPTDGQALVWDNANSKWEPGTVSGGGGSSVWTTSGSDIYYTTGNVGIGTSSPAQALHISGSAQNAYIEPLVQNTANPGAAGFAFKNLTQEWKVGVNTSDQYRIRDHTNSTNVFVVESGASADSFRISPAGNVGIGTSLPLVKLHVSGTEARVENGGIARLNLNNTNGLAAGLATGSTSSIFSFDETGVFAIQSRTKSEILNGQYDAADNRLVVTGSGNVGIGTTTPAKALDVVGEANILNASNSVLISTSNDGTNTSNTVIIGNNAVNSATTGSRDNSVFIGSGVAQNATNTLNYGQNTWIGFEAGKNRGGPLSYDATLIGYQAGLAGQASVAIGKQASNSGGSSTIAVGIRSHYNNSGGGNVAIGNNSLGYSATSSSTAVGNEAGSSSGGSSSVFLGHSASKNGTANYSVLVGLDSGRENDGDNNVAVGYQTISETTTGSTISNSVALGYQALKGTTTSTAAGIVAVGYQALTALTTGANNTAVGYQAGDSITTGSNNTLIGYVAGQALTTGSDNVEIGKLDYVTGAINTSSRVRIGSDAGLGGSSVAIGHGTGRNSTSGNSTAIGKNALFSGTGGQNIAIGVEAANLFGGGQYNVYMGHRQGKSTSGSSYNVSIGGNTQNNGDNNVIIGYQAGVGLTTASDGNVLLGYQAGNAETGSNKLYIENSNSTTPLIYGEFDNDILRVNGTLQVNDPSSTGYAFPTATGTLGQVLEVDASGDLVFATPSGGGGGGLGGADQTLTADRTIDTNGYNLDIELDPTGTADTFTIHDGTHDLFQVDTGTTGVLFSVNDVSGLPKLEVDEDEGVIAKSIKVDDGALTVAGQYGKGAEIWYQGTSTPTAGSVYYLDSSGNWANTDASAVATAKGMLSVSAGTDSDVDGMVIKGFVYVGTDPGGNVGDVVYLSETANQLTTTAPTTASAAVRVCGYKVGTNIVYFDPSKDWIELS